MKIRTPFIVGAAVGYVFGTKAGRERYEQIMRMSHRVTENPTVQEKTEVLRTKGGELAGVAKTKAGAAMETARDRAPASIGDRIPGRTKTDDTAQEKTGQPS